MWWRNYSQTLVYGLFFLHAKIRTIEIRNIETKLQTTCFYFIKHILKTKRDLKLISLPDFVIDFWRENLSSYIQSPDEISLSSDLYLVRCAL